jgi:excisionase family DNA binding protein
MTSRDARIRAALQELADAITEALDRDMREPSPDRLYGIAEAAKMMGIGRSALYSAIAAGTVRSVKVGRRRLIPAASIREVASGQ